MRSRPASRKLFAAAAALTLAFVALPAALAGRSADNAAAVSLLRVAVNTTVSSLDPARQNSAQAQWTANLGLEKLVKIDRNGKIQPHLAQSIRQPNAFTYIYTLRKGVKFWNGAELTATDVANALNYYRTPTVPTSSIPGWSSVRSIRANGRYTVTVTLKKRDAAWQNAMAISGWIFEKKFGDEHRETMGRPGVLTMGTGPWKFDSFDPTRGVELSANPSYWGGKVNVQRVSLRFIPDATAQALAFRAREIDLILSVPDARAFEATSGARVTLVPTCGVRYFAMNTTRAPWDDVHFRRAFAYAIDRNGVIAAAGGPATGRPLATLVSPQQLASLGTKAQVNKLLSGVPQYPFNLDKARQELAMSKYPNGASADVPTINGSPVPELTQAIAAMVARIGIKLNIKLIPASEWLSLVVAPRDQLSATWIGFPCASPDPAVFPYQFAYSKEARPGRYNNANYKNPAMDRAIETARTTTDPERRRASFRQILLLLGRDVPYVPLYTSSQNYALAQGLTWTGYHTFILNGPWALGIGEKS
jgi:peptide/nickel transport system substrate-binding protein